MPSSVTAFCLPVTALAAVDLGSARLILSGQGPFLKVLEFATRRGILTHQVFNNQCIHGITIKKEPDASNNDHVISILIWGGRSFSFSKLLVSSLADVEHNSQLLVGDEVQNEDWILDAKIWPVDDELVSSTFNRAALIAIHNVIYTIQGSSRADRVNSTTEVVRLAGGLQSVLYSAQIIVSSSSSLLIASGTVFGEILVWSCSIAAEPPQPACTTHHILRGHQGSIFGVSISDEINSSALSAPTRLLASCSDDRTIRIWDVGPCRHDPQTNGNDAVKQNVRENRRQGTGFGLSNTTLEQSKSHCTVSSYGHQSRIWGVYFIDEDDRASPDLLRLVSIGEDATLQQWAISIHESHPNHSFPYQINNVFGDCFHSGRNIWSFTHLNCHETLPVLLTGGADGAIVGRSTLSSSYRRSESVSRAFEFTFESLLGGAGDLQDVSQSSMLKNYAWLSESCFVAVTDRGRVLQGNLQPQDIISDQPNCEGDEENVSLRWKLISTPHELGSYSVVASSTKKTWALISNESAQLWLAIKDSGDLRYLCQLKRKPAGIFLIDIDSELSTLDRSVEQMVFGLLTYPGSDDSDLMAIYRTKSSDNFGSHLYSTLQLPPNFIVTSCLSLAQLSVLILGSRAGALATYRPFSCASQINFRLEVCKRHVHGEDAITCLVPLSSAGKSGSYFLSCGRDGRYAVHVLSSCGSEPQLRTVHQTSPPLGAYIEGAYVSPNSGDIFLYGFRGKDFVLWNETKQMQQYSVDCGGAHRSWAFHPQGCQRSSFIWTRASAFKAFIQEPSSHHRLQEGGHGREIKALAVSPVHFNTPLIVTGAEDTTLRFSTIIYADKREPQLRYLRTLKRHTNGIQHLQWSTCGQLLFSSSGYEELFAWRVSEVPGFGLGAVCVAASPKETSISDLRITSFDIRMLDSDEFGGLRCLIAAGYSNSTLRVFRYSDSNAWFELEAYGQYKANCLTLVSFLPGPKDQSCYNILSASTDGGLAIWHPHYPEDVTLSAQVVELRWEESHQVHQSSIKALQMAVLSDSYVLVVTGGDDNALGFTLVGQSETDHDNVAYRTNRYQFASILLPSAHAASITAVSIIQNRSGIPNSFNVFSAGNDQCVKSWTVLIDITSMEGMNPTCWMEALDIRKGLCHHTAVADVGAMCILDEQNQDQHDQQSVTLIIAGVGIEILNFTI